MQPAERKFDRVPLLDLQRQYQSIRAEVLASIERVCDSQQFILGTEVESLEREIGAFIGTASAVACASGTDALWLALAASGVRPGDAVITSPFSFLASASAIVRAGALPVFADVDPQTLNLDASQVALLLRSDSHKVRALLPVHLYGQCADMEAMSAVAAEFKLLVVEDAAQAIGAEWDGRRAGTIGTTAAFSFYPTKNLSAFGEAGLVSARDPEVAEHMRRLRNHGSSRRYVHEELGWNARMDAIQAAVLRVKLPRIEQWNNQRRAIAANYDRLLNQAGLAGTIDPPHTAAPAYHVFHQYVVRAKRRDQLRQFLTDRQIGTEVYYPLPLHLQPCFKYLGYQKGSFPQAERAAQEVLALPMFPELTENEQQWVVENIVEFYS